MCLIGLYHQWDLNPAPYQTFTFVLMGVHACWNSQFFGRQAVEANIVDVVNRFDMRGNSGEDAASRKAAVKLPKVRALSGKLPRTAGKPTKKTQ